jgi:glycosyltransferase involved in cell wall biosynthesis
MQQVSVIIPAYNCSLYIRETLESILSQGAANLQVIVVNDGSSDDTGDIARSFGKSVTVIDQANAGVCAARNHGIRHANGEFIALVDHDDFWLENKLANQLAAFEKNPQVDVVFSDFTWWHHDPATGRFEKPASPSLSPSNASQPDIDSKFSGWIYHQMLIDSYVLTSTALTRTRVVKAANGFDEKLPFGCGFRAPRSSSNSRINRLFTASIPCKDHGY